ncbi:MULTISPECIES: metalloregulator ArsR/SmtB family transcription factor [Vibrio]|uniref:Metalloregulator ArsR/SmtB family transcription factor n=1 Tax=Vibrio ostreae TaxID=2841925 RepID=A0A975YN77_9VIBR|nr:MULTISPECIES: metalloregulator ArsR/SmtB family transcription factor [Vibrio]QXO17493.1 metalloregulator ArsR/SmtB family transcription factor [Vibrio ostreae]WGY48196.1 metalloregulator ArsR/SmtB family transcription factor [Vibrio sp. ABG19]
MLPHQFFKLLADETRLRCLLLIARERRLCVCELTYALQESQPKISRHLAQLRQSGVLLDERQGQWVFYRLSPALPAWLQTVIDGLQQADNLQQQYVRDSERLQDMAERPCC